MHRYPVSTLVKILHILDERWDSALTAYGLVLAQVQAARGHAVWVAVKPGLYADREARRRGLSVYPLGSYLGFRWFVGRHKFDVINAHTGSGHTLGLWAVAGRMTALVRTRGDARPVEKKPGQAWILKRTDSVIAASRAIAARYRDRYPSLQGRLSTIYPGLELPPMSPEPAGPLRFALVGRLDPIKGQTYFIEALSLIKDKLSDEEFLIAGEPKNTTVGGLQRFAEKCGVAHWVRFLGRQPDILAFMRSCHAGVICSIGSETLSRVCLEWMAVGRPVIATAVGCLPELVFTGENGFLVPTHSPKALADCLMGLIKNEGFRREMGERARRFAETRFSLERFGTDTDNIYFEAMMRRGGVKIRQK